MRSEVVLVTPELANEWLKKNKPNNRKIRPSHVEYLAREMTQNSKSLEKQIIEIKQLSDDNIAREKEKQKMK